MPARSKTQDTDDTSPKAGALSSADAARYLGMSPKTLQNRRSLGLAPRHGNHPGGGVYYRVADLDAYLSS